MTRPDVLVIGAGPSGLSAALACREARLETLVAERGPLLADRGAHAAEGTVCGAGGAGLYSDGKLSFFPSASGVWGLRPERPLRRAYAWTTERIGHYGVAAPALPSSLPDASILPEDGRSLVKQYASQYMSLPHRMALIDELSAELGSALRVETHAKVRTLHPPVVELIGRHGTTVVHPRVLIVASGRFGPLEWSCAPARVRIFRRIEVGVRVEQPAAHFILDPHAQIDPKWIRRSSDGCREWRTFCCCRRGEVVRTSFNGIDAMSGRADGPPSERSNFGFNVRLLEEPEAMQTLRHLRDRRERSVISTPALSLLDDPERSLVGSSIGPVAARALAEGLTALAADHEGDLSDATLHGPAIEGWGYYPRVNARLRVGRAPVWVTGDASGLFRGLTAAMVSGHFAGQMVAAGRRQPGPLAAAPDPAASAGS